MDQAPLLAVSPRPVTLAALMPRGSGIRCSGAVVLALALVGSSAAAQPSPPKQHSDQAYREGVELAKANKLDAALKKFEDSRASAPNARATYQMGRMEHLLGRFDLALLHYRQSLKEEGLPTQERSDAVKAIDELKTKVAVIQIESPPGVTITVDGNVVADPKAPVEVAPGAHVVKGTLGGEARTVDTNLEAGKVAVVKISFEATPGPTPNGQSPNPNANSNSNSNANPPPTSPTEPPPEPPRSFWTTPHIAGIGLAGLAVVGAGVSVGFVLSHEHHISEQEGLARGCITPGSATCNSFNDHGDSADTAKTIAIIAGIASGAAAAGAVALFLWPTKSTTAASSKRPNALANAPAPTARVVPTGPGVAVVGTF